MSELLNKLKQDFMVMSLLFQFLEDWMSGFKVMANNILAKQMLAASLNITNRLAKKKIEATVYEKSLLFQFCEIR